MFLRRVYNSQHFKISHKSMFVLIKVYIINIPIIIKI